MMVRHPLVALVDDDESVRESLPELLRELGFAAKAFSSAEEFLASQCIHETRCLILDVAMPGMSGPDLHSVLLQQGYSTPVVFITALASGSRPPELLQKGVVACLTKPFSEQELRGALAIALPDT